MKKIIIKHFNTKQQHRIEFIRLLIEFNSQLGLKGAKDKLDSMLFDNIPIEMDLQDDKLDGFTAELDKLILEYEIK